MLWEVHNNFQRPWTLISLLEQNQNNCFLESFLIYPLTSTQNNWLLLKKWMPSAWTIIVFFLFPIAVSIFMSIEGSKG